MLGAGHEITRFKGLGKISVGEFKDFIGENIRLDPINLAVSVIGHQCRHCSSTSEVPPKLRKLDLSTCIAIVLVISGVIYWAMFTP